MTKRDAQFILEEKAISVYKYLPTKVKTTANVLDPQHVSYLKQEILTSALNGLKDELVKVTPKRKVPSNGQQEVDVLSDFVVLKRADFRKLMKYVDNE